MARTIDGTVAAHQAAIERRAQGRPVWDRRIDLRDVFHSSDMTFEQRRDMIVRRIYRSGWAASNTTVLDLVEELAAANDVEDFDEVWDAIYDVADIDRVWVATT